VSDFFQITEEMPCTKFLICARGGHNILNIAIILYIPIVLATIQYEGRPQYNNMNPHDILFILQYLSVHCIDPLTLIPYHDWLGVSARTEQ
jgi:hypothetical protein